MKSFSISKLTTGVLISLLAVSLAGCSTTSNKKASSTENPVVSQLEKEAIQPKGEGASIIAPAKEIKAEDEKVETEITSQDNDEVASAKDEEIQYPLGINPIVVSDEDYSVFDLFIVHTADVEGQVQSSENSIGYAKLSTMMKAARSITNNILLVDAGNALSGSCVVDETMGETAGALLYMTGYDAFVPQVEDYAFGDKALLEAAKLAKNNTNLKVLSANTLDKNEYLPFQPYQLYDFNGFKVCVVGLTGPFNNKTIDFTFDSDVVLQNAQYAIDMASQYADYIVVVGSMDTVSSEFICKNINGIDLFIDGSKSSVESGTIVNGTTIVNTKAKMAEVGVVDIVIKDGKVTSVSPFDITANDVNNPKDSQLATAYGIVNIPMDSETSNYIDSQEEIVNMKLSKPVANLPNTLVAEDSNITKSTLAKFFVEGLTNIEGVDASIISGGSFLNSLMNGEVSTLDINNSIDSSKDICLTQMTGAQIYAALELGYSSLPEGSMYFPQTDLKVVYNKYAKPGKRILRVKLGKSYIDKSATYKIATDSSLCEGTSTFDMGNLVSVGDSLNNMLLKMLVEKFPSK